MVNGYHYGSQQLGVRHLTAPFGSRCTSHTLRTQDKQLNSSQAAVSTWHTPEFSPRTACCGGYSCKRYHQRTVRPYTSRLTAARRSHQPVKCPTQSASRPRLVGHSMTAPFLLCARGKARSQRLHSGRGLEDAQSQERGSSVARNRSSSPSDAWVDVCGRGLECRESSRFRGLHETTSCVWHTAHV